MRLDGLLAQLGEIDGLARLRFTTSHPRDMDAALIAAHGNNEKLMPYLHLPVQSGSDAILKAMNRKHKAADYIALVKKFRAARPIWRCLPTLLSAFPAKRKKILPPQWLWSKRCAMRSFRSNMPAPRHTGGR